MKWLGIAVLLLYASLFVEAKAVEPVIETTASITFKFYKTTEEVNEACHDIAPEGALNPETVLQGCRMGMTIYTVTPQGWCDTDSIETLGHEVMHVIGWKHGPMYSPPIFYGRDLGCRGGEFHVPPPHIDGQPATVAGWKAHARLQSVYRDLPPGLLEAVCTQESRWRNVEGQHGEIGVCQVKPSTYKFLYPQWEQDTNPVLLKYGDRGEQVLEAQAVLASQGLYRGALDGIWGPKTHRAVIAFQEAAGVAVDGVIGPQTWAALGLPATGQTVEQRLWDPETNIEVAAQWLKWCSWELDTDSPAILAACYNAGAGHPVVRYMAQTMRRVQFE